FVELRENGEEKEAWRVAGMVLWATTVILGAISAVFILLAPLLVPVLMVGTDNVSSDLVASLTRILFPIVVLLRLFGVVPGVLTVSRNAARIFGVPPFAPVVCTLLIIFFVLALGRDGTLEHRATMYACGILVATIVQFLIPLPLLRGSGIGLAFNLGFGNPHV